MSATERLRPYALLMRLERPSGALLAPSGQRFAAHGTPDLRILVIFVPGVWVVCSAGCVMSDYADRGFDLHVARNGSMFALARASRENRCRSRMTFRLAVPALTTDGQVHDRWP